MKSRFLQSKSNWNPKIMEIENCKIILKFKAKRSLLALNYC